MIIPNWMEKQKKLCSERTAAEVGRAATAVQWNLRLPSKVQAPSPLQ